MLVFAELHNQQATGVEFSRDGNLVVTCSRDSTLKVSIMGCSSGCRISRAGRGCSHLEHLCHSQRHNQRFGHLAAVRTRIWRTSLLAPYKNAVNYGRATFSPHGKYVIAGSSDGGLTKHIALVVYSTFSRNCGCLGHCGWQCALSSWRYLRQHLWG